MLPWQFLIYPILLCKTQYKNRTDNSTLPYWNTGDSKVVIHKLPASLSFFFYVINNAFWLLNKHLWGFKNALEYKIPRVSFTYTIWFQIKSPVGSLKLKFD